MMASSVPATAVDDEFAINAADIDAGDWAVEWDVGDAEGKGSAEQAGHFRGVVWVAAHDGGDDLDFVAETIGE